MGTGPIGSVFAENSFIEKHAGNKKLVAILLKVVLTPANFRDGT